MRILAPWLIVLPPLLLLGQCTSEFFAVDACLDAGQVYDYTRGICREDVQHLPYVSYIERSRHLVVGAAASIGVGVLVLIKRRDHRESSAF
jgi:hypothetical protein